MPMRILFICPYVPSLIRVRSFNFIRTMHKRGHEVTLIVLTPPNEPDSTLGKLREWCKEVYTVPHSRSQVLMNGVRGLFSSLPLQASYSYSPAFAAKVQEVLARNTFDVAHIEHIRGYLLADGLEKQLPVVFDAVDSITLLFEKTVKEAPSLKSKLMAQLDLGRTRHFEGQVMTQHFTHTAICSELDKAACVKLGASANRIYYVPSCVDVEYFQPQTVERDPLQLIFTGKLSYHANIAAVTDLVEQIMPLVWKQEPNARLQIVGKDPPDSILAYGEQFPNVEVHGFVPDLRPYIAKANVAVCYVRYGVGLTTKTVESMAMGSAVVATPHAVSTLKVQHGCEVMIGDTQQAIADHIVTLIRNPEQARALGVAARKYVETYQTWDRSVSILEDMYAEAANLWHSKSAHK
ncbi:MAG: glycosyltransferase [Anaerolineaceae bacterium]|nr:glycosyltransferase [Anaerolineaceae bacterium]